MVRNHEGDESARQAGDDRHRTSATFDVGNDLRHAIRALRRRTGFTGVAAITLALGIGATTALFGVVKQVLLTPLPYGDSKGIVVVWSAWKAFDRTWLSYDEWEGWRARIPAFRDIGLFTDGSATMDGDVPERVRVANVHANIFTILGVAPAIGRGFAAEEDRPGGPAVAILGHQLWQRRFNGDPNIVGRDVSISGSAVQIVGVMPAGFRLPLDFGADGPTEVFFPLATDASQLGAVPGPEFPVGGASHGFYSVARLAPGATAATANAQLRSLVAELERFGYMAGVGFRAFVVPVEEQITGRVRPVLLVVFGAVVLVMLIACANVAGLMLVRGDGRRRELAVRVALGADARRLVRLLLTESAVLAALGGAIGIALAVGAVRLVRATAPASMPRIADTAVDWNVLLFAVAAAVVAAMLAGLLPAVQAAGVAPAGELKDGSRAATTGRARLRWRQGLVAAEVALAVVLVAGAGLMVRSVRNLLAIDAGIQTQRVLTMRVTTPASWYPDSVRVAGFWDDVQRRVAALPGVSHAGAVRALPLASEIGDWGLQIEGYTPPPNEGAPGDWQIVTPGYFEAMGLTLRDGRFLDTRDDFAGALSLVVNRAFVAKYLDGRDPLGVQVRIGNPAAPPYTIVGVVEDVRHNSLTGAAKPGFYATLSQFARSQGNTRRSMSLVVRTAADPKTLITPVRAAIRSVDARLPVSEIRTMGDVIDSAIAGQRFAMQLLGLFGALALLLSAIGIYGIVSQVVASRMHELGIRAALGATPRELVGIGLRSGARQAIVGLAIGIAMALVLTRALGTLLHGVTATDPWTFAAVVMVTGIITVLASVGPARRAGRTDPAKVLTADA